MPRAEFQCRQQHPFAAELVVYLGVLLEEFEDDRLVLHLGLLGEIRGYRVQARSSCRKATQNPEPLGQAPALPCRLGVLVSFETLPLLLLFFGRLRLFSAWLRIDPVEGHLGSS